MDLEANLQSYLGGNNANPDGRDSTERNASFDYCFNHFQSYRESGKVHELASPANVQLSCLHLGFYLASWGMLRNSKLIDGKECQVPGSVEVIATADASLWEIDADCYTATNIQRLAELAGKICDALPGVRQWQMRLERAEYEVSHVSVQLVRSRSTRYQELHELPL